MHDAYIVTYQGSNSAASAGTSASTPAMAGIVALLNQYQISKGFQSQPGLGNINPQLYRLAQTLPAVFHDIVAGDNHRALRAGHAGLPHRFVRRTRRVRGTTCDRPGLHRRRQAGEAMEYRVKRRDGEPGAERDARRRQRHGGRHSAGERRNGTPTGRVDFSADGVPLGSAALVSRGGQGQAADITFPAYLLGTGTIAWSRRPTRATPHSAAAAQPGI